ncbi:MAG: hypothetical protein HYV78_01385 [Candidatus Wildermuthbacteria bacterium]|nr:hypothetical protein [Candidatus Wildermuthbacteria bacterium]
MSLEEWVAGKKLSFHSENGVIAVEGSIWEWQNVLCNPPQLPQSIKSFLKSFGLTVVIQGSEKEPIMTVKGHMRLWENLCGFLQGSSIVSRKTAKGE